ncbi:deoxyribose-phosphate aldolase [Candidatus Sumerlaeota bacterium]|nr:deoxyribose-phosphate aldolase [Candidatus Sumerlaeota bacterium]MBI3736017.1 deoxyribose-phosphate aldolase [Candidatus Sumerlaeota bacterium]
MIPCAIPPPGSPRYESTLRFLDTHSGEKKKEGECDCGCGGNKIVPGDAVPPAPESDEPFPRREGLFGLIQEGAHRVGRPDHISPPACRDLAPYIDHTLLRANATEREVVELCREALRFKFASVCVNPHFVPLCAGMLKGSPVKVCTVVGFPLGAMTCEAKAFEARDAVAKGADEIDMVINVGRLKSGDFTYVLKDIRSVIEAAQGRTVKVILETSLLTDEEKVAACVIARAAGAHFVKTSTGFGSGGASVEDVALMRGVVGADLKIKAAGGIRDCRTAREMIASGADRLGASASIAIVQGLNP